MGIYDGIPLKSTESIAGGDAHPDTLAFARAVMSGNIPGGVKYFSSFNDAFHQGKGGRHPTGQAFDLVLSDPSKNMGALAAINALASTGGYRVKLLNEYTDPSHHATGGHLHVSVLGKGEEQAGQRRYMAMQGAMLLPGLPKVAPGEEVSNKAWDSGSLPTVTPGTEVKPASAGSGVQARVAEQRAQLKADEARDTGWDYAKGIMREGAKGLSFGVAPKAVALADAVRDKITKGTPIGEGYLQHAKDNEARDRQFAEKYPAASTAANIGGSLVGGLAGAGMRAIAGAPAINGVGGLAITGTGMGSRIGQGAINATAAGGISGAASAPTGDTMSESLANMGKGALKGAVTGAALGGGIGAVNIAAKAAGKAGAATKEVYKRLIDPEEYARFKVADQLMKSGVTDNIDDAVNLAKKTLDEIGPDAMLADVGQTAGLARSLTQKPGSAAELGKTALRTRQETAATRATGDLRDAMKVTGSYADELANQEGVRKQAGKLFEDVKSQPFTASKRLQTLANEPQVKSALNDSLNLENARRIARGENPLSFEEGLNHIGIWTGAKSSLGAMGEGLSRGSVLGRAKDPVGGMLYNTHADTIVNELDDATGGAYRKALDAYQAPMQTLGALKNSRAARALNMKALEVQQAMGRLSPEGKNAYRMGTIEGVLERQRTAHGNPTAILNSPKRLQAVQAAAPDLEGANKIADIANREARYAGTYQAHVGGSKTAPVILEHLQSTEAPIGGLAALGGGAMSVASNPYNPIGWLSLGKGLADRFTGLPEKNKEALASVLFGSREEAKRFLDSIKTPKSFHAQRNKTLERLRNVIYATAGAAGGRQ